MSGKSPSFEWRILGLNSSVRFFNIHWDCKTWKSKSYFAKNRKCFLLLFIKIYQSISKNGHKRHTLHSSQNIHHHHQHHMCLYISLSFEYLVLNQMAYLIFNGLTMRFANGTVQTLFGYIISRMDTWFVLIRSKLLCWLGFVDKWCKLRHVSFDPKQNTAQG